MAKKLAGYVFRRIRGRIVPIRKSLGLVDETINRAVAGIRRTPSGKDFKAVGPDVEKIGRGVDFTAFKFDNSAKVLKVPRSNPTRQITDKYMLKAVPNINDKVARAQALAHNLPNYGVETLGGFSVRLSRKLKALVQPFEDIATNSQKNPNGLTVSEAYKNIARTKREADRLSFQSGLHLDAHSGNITHRGLLVDTALGKLPTRQTLTQRVPQVNMMKQPVGVTSDPDMARELLTGGNVGLGPADFKKADFMTAQAALEGSSGKINRLMKKLRKEGFRFKPAANRGVYSPSDIDQGSYSLVSPTERIEAAKKTGVRFVKKNGRVVPVRPKK
jgi:hypothetical protein